MLGKEKKWLRATDTEWERCSQLVFPKLAELINFFMPVRHSYTPCVTESKVQQSSH